REITFTIMSMTISLVAVFIPVFFMGGVVGRVFHEFAIVIGIAILASGLVSLTLTPMLCSRFLRPHFHDAPDGPIARLLERGFAAMLRGYEISLGWVMRHQRFTTGVTLLPIGITGYLFYAIPKGFFPIEDTGYIIGGTETAEDTSFAGMLDKQIELEAVLRASPYVVSYNLEVSLGGRGIGNKTGELCIHSRP